MKELIGQWEGLKKYIADTRGLDATMYYNSKIVVVNKVWVGDKGDTKHTEAPKFVFYKDENNKLTEWL